MLGGIPPWRVRISTTTQADRGQSALWVTAELVDVVRHTEMEIRPGSYRLFRGTRARLGQGPNEPWRRPSRASLPAPRCAPSCELAPRPSAEGPPTAVLMLPMAHDTASATGDGPSRSTMLLR